MAVVLVRSLMAEGGCSGLFWASILVLKRRTNLNKIVKVMRLWRVLYLIAMQDQRWRSLPLLTNLDALPRIVSSVFSYQAFHSALTSFNIVTSTVDAILLEVTITMPPSLP